MPFLTGDPLAIVLSFLTPRELLVRMTCVDKETCRCVCERPLAWPAHLDLRFVHRVLPQVSWPGPAWLAVRPDATPLSAPSTTAQLPWSLVKSVAASRHWLQLLPGVATSLQVSRRGARTPLPLTITPRS